VVRPTIILTHIEVERLVDLPALIPAVANTYAGFEIGNDLLPDKFLVRVGGGQAACMTGYTHASNKLTMKLGQERLANVKRGLPTSFGVINLFDPDTGELLLICESMLPTQFRTAAAAAVGVDLLARKDARTLAVLGAGRLGRQCIRAISTIRPFERVVLSSRTTAGAEALAKDLREEISIPIQVTDPESACRNADVICTATNSLVPSVRNDWILPATLLCCMGADLPEKIECDLALTARSRLVADHVEHCIKRGEASQAIQAGLVSANPFAGSLGQVINGTIPGRTFEDEITMFDSIGVGILDTTIATQIYEQAQQQGVGLRVNFV